MDTIKVHGEDRPTQKQIDARAKLVADWGNNPIQEYYDGICDCLMLCMDSKLWQSKIWIGIEIDGYTHS